MNELKESIYNEILSNRTLQGELIALTGKSYSTIRKWAVQKTADLTQWAILKHLQKFFALDKKEDLFSEVDSNKIIS